MNDIHQDDVPVKPVYSRRLHYAGAVLWASFLAACIGSMVFFAMFDPSELGRITTWPIALSRKWGYTLGFFGFWLLTLLSSAVTAFLLAPCKKPDKAGDDGK